MTRFKTPTREQMAKKARMRRMKRNSPQAREVRAKGIANRPGTPPPNIDDPGTRLDVNYYRGGPSYIRDIGVIEKRKK